MTAFPRFCAAVYRKLNPIEDWAVELVAGR
jgi:hypothetical protein